MSKFQPGDAVRLQIAVGVVEAPLRRVVWTHPDAGVTVELADVKAGEDTQREKVDEDQVVFADPVLQYFVWGHLKPPLAEVSQAFGRLAHELVFSLPDCLQRTIALQHLLEAKDAAVRARLTS